MRRRVRGPLPRPVLDGVPPPDPDRVRWEVRYADGTTCQHVHSWKAAAHCCTRERPGEVIRVDINLNDRSK